MSTNTLDARTDESKKRDYIAYKIPIQDKEDISDLVRHIYGFLSVAISNNKEMVIEIHYTS